MLNTIVFLKMKDDYDDCLGRNGRWPYIKLSDFIFYLRLPIALVEISKNHLQYVRRSACLVGWAAMAVEHGRS